MSAPLRGMSGDYIEVPNRPDEVRINCPFCVQNGRGDDTKHHCYVNMAKGLFNCFRCEARGSISLLKGKLGFRQQGTTDLNAVKEKIKGLNNRNRNEPEMIDLDVISRPMSSGTTPVAYKYMKDRRFSDDEIKKYGLRVGRSYEEDITGDLVTRWKDRIIFPFFEQGKVTFVVARAYTGKQPKYINSFGSKNLVVYGIDSVHDQAILCEGIISAIAAERTTSVPAVSVLGKTITTHQLSKLKSKCSKLYVCLDGDCTRREKNKLNRQLIAAGFQVWEINLPEGADPDDLGIRFKDYFRRARRVKLL